MRANPIHLVLAMSLLISGAVVLQSCESCNTSGLRRYGSTCGSDSECSGGVCFRGRCTKSCQADSECAGGICIAQICQTNDDDYDGDGLTNGTELALGTDPQNEDSDGDGLSDKAEIGNVSSPTDTNKDGKIDALQSNKHDFDGDCMVDAYDLSVTDPQKTGLPDVKQFCNTGVCADHLSDVTIVCAKKAPTYTGVVLGCVGCQCHLDAAKVPDWQGTELFCDGLDNDCDGLTDEDLTFNKKSVGQGCAGLYGVCAQADANGQVPQGTVECGTDKLITCSVHGNGSQSVALPERCNYVDDDCDGKSDEDFTWQASATSPILNTGEACNVCGAKTLICPSGAPANPPVVACSGDATRAVCSAVPYDAGFVERFAGRPQPRLHWSAALAGDPTRLLVYGGAVYSPIGASIRADLWTLDVTPNTPAAWKRLRNQAPGAVDGGALVADPDGKRTLLVGGRIDGQTSDKVWALDTQMIWTIAADVPPLTLAAQGDGLSAAIVGSGATRRLVLFSPTSPAAAHWVAVGGASAWQALTLPAPPAGLAKLTGTPGCLVPAIGGSAYALVLSNPTVGEPSATYRIRATSAGVSLDVVAASGSAPSRLAAMCVLRADGTLSIFGGHVASAPSAGGARRAVFGGPAETATSLVWSDDSATPLAKLERSGGWSGQLGGTTLVLGGYRRTGGTSEPWHRLSTDGPVALSNGAIQLEGLDAPAPRPRVGAASGYAAGVGLCAAGGLGFDLPDEGQTTARVLPLTDAWCADDAGAWTQVATGLPPFAFGISGVDPGTKALVLAGGLKLTVDTPVFKAERIWRAGLDFRKSKQATSQLLEVTDAVHQLALPTGVLTSLPKDKAGPLLAGSSVVVDKARRRLISFGGFHDTAPTDNLWVLDLATMTWQDVAKNYPVGTNRPLPGYGQLVTYISAADSLLVAGGANFLESVDSNTQLRQPGEWVIVYQTASGAKLAVTDNPCYGPDTSLLWSVPTLSTPVFGYHAVPTFADLDGTTLPTKPLLRLQFGQPAFTPVLFDAAGNHGILALQPAVQYAKVDANKQTCPGLVTSTWTDASVQMRLSIGQCNGAPRVFLDEGGLTTMPDSLVGSIGHYDDIGRRSWVWSGLGPDGRLGSGLWSLSQTCTPPAP